MTAAEVRLSGGSYPILIGPGAASLVGSADAADVWAERRRAFLVSDRTVWRLHGAGFERQLHTAGLQVLGRAVLEPGEPHKNLASVVAVWDALVAAGVERGDTLIAFGGGVVGDIAGFAAATYLRGIDFVQVPTTLLAMVDSSVGGKTGVDHPRGKNLIGAFHQPRAVYVDLDYLGTLPQREILSGFAEIIKAGLVGDPELFALLVEVGPAIQRDPAQLEDAVTRAVLFKAGVVAEDEKEDGPRAILNFGHTIGHALEASTEYGRFTHGEAVGFGMMVATRLSQELGSLTSGEAQLVLALLKRWEFPLRIAGVDTEKIMECMQRDKKSRGGRIRWVLLKAIGEAEYDVQVAPATVRSLLSEATI